MEESTNNFVQSRASAFRVVRPTSCYAPSLLAFPPQFWYSGARFPYPSVSHYQDIYSIPSSGRVVTPPSDKLSFCYSNTTSSLCAPVSSIGSTGLQVQEYEENDGGHRLLSPHTSPKTENNVIFHTSQAGQNCGQMEVWDSVPTSSNPVDCSKESLCRSEKKKPARHNTTCSVCHKVFGRVTTLKVHLRIHRGEKPFKCSYCGKSFSQSGNLTTHIRVHTGEKPFSCKVCDKHFSQSSALKGHMKIHLREDSKNSTSEYVNLPRERPGDEINTSMTS